LPCDRAIRKKIGIIKKLIVKCLNTINGSNLANILCIYVWTKAAYTNILRVLWKSLEIAILSQKGRLYTIYLVNASHQTFYFLKRNRSIRESNSAHE